MNATLAPTVAALYESWQESIQESLRLGFLCIEHAAYPDRPGYLAAKEGYQRAMAAVEESWQRYRVALRASCGPDPSAPAQDRVMAAYDSAGCPCMREIEAPTGVRRRRDHEDITGVPNEEMR